MARLFLGIDSGTQGVKVVALDEATKTLIAESSAPHELITNDNGRREQHPSWWIDAVSIALEHVLAADGVDRSSVAGIGVSGQQHGMVCLDAKGEVIRPAKLWCDTETAPQARGLTDAIGGNEAVVAATGNSMAAGFTAPKLAWLKENEPEAYERVATVLLPHDYLNFWLTGEKKTECGDASGTAYFDVHSRTWNPMILSAIDPSGKLEACLPELIASDAPVGLLRPEIADRFGLSESVVVSSGGGDNMMAAIGTGNVVPGVVTTSLGTSGTIFACADHPVVDPQGELAAFCSSTGLWLPLICTMNVTVATETVRSLLGKSVAELNQAAQAAPAGSHGVMLLPYFNGERTPALPEARGVFAGLTPSNMTPDNLCRAAMEGATYGLRYGLDVLVRLGVVPTEIRLVGGGSKSRLWRQILADIFGCPVVCPTTAEAGALGAAIQALWCRRQYDGVPIEIGTLTQEYVGLDPTSRVEPDTNNQHIYEDCYQRYLDLNAAARFLYG
ncbi:xylulokinase [Desulfovibrio inopinatus]|uniref:xylulokinase n=1 Tax=Desulfovibrio inopinatus TaxID=102109 RepID=UPI00041A7F8E|nr:xylulokinase [Desulfovibrio inopinatus]